MKIESIFGTYFVLENISRFAIVKNYLCIDDWTYFLREGDFEEARAFIDKIKNYLVDKA